jgi:hypothetical protein
MVAENRQSRVAFTDYLHELRSNVTFYLLGRMTSEQEHEQMYGYVCMYVCMYGTFKTGNEQILLHLTALVDFPRSITIQ